MLVRLAGASSLAAANVGLVAAAVLLVFHGWSAARRRSCAAGKPLLATAVAAGLGLVMIVLKDLVLIHLHEKVAVMLTRAAATKSTMIPWAA